MNLSSLTERDKQILRNKMIERFEKSEPETWAMLNISPEYLISSHGRIKHLKSYMGLPRILCPSLKFGRYLYYTVTVNGSRKGISLNAVMDLHFNSK